MKSSINTKWKGNMCFEAEIGGHKLMLDSDEASGGSNLGPRPKPLMMAALAGCTGMDVVSILKKMRVEFDELNIRVEGETRDEHPKSFYKMKVIYEFKGKDLPLDKIQKAVNLSEVNYCGVRASYAPAMELSSEIVIIS
ncbi:MAG: OsmC family protein [Bacteroidales bacterium]